MRLRIPTSIALLLLLLASALGAQEEESTAERYWRLRAQFASELEVLCGWCGGEELWAEQARLAPALLAFDPESSVARAAARLRRPENEGEEGALEQLAEREAELAAEPAS